MDDSKYYRYNAIHMSIFYNWQILLIPALVVIISQLIKVVLEIRNEPFKWSYLNAYGGMPSTHTAGFVSLTLIVGIMEGFDSALFAVAAACSIAFIRDAVGIRWSLGFHAKVLNRMRGTLSPEDQKHIPKHLEEQLGHTPKEALVGGILGALLTLLLHFLFT